MVHIKRRKKTKNQKHHSRLRALQRFGIGLTNNDLDKMADIYRHSPDTVILRKQSNRVVKALIDYNRTVFPIIYDKERHQLATILDPAYLNPEEKKKYDKYVTKVEK